MDWKWLCEVLVVPLAFGLVASAVVCIFAPDAKELIGAVVGALLTRVKLSKPSNGA